MKLSRLILLLAVLIVAGSCNTDDDGGPGAFLFNKDNLTGTYSLGFHESKKVKTKEVEGFNVTTTTIGKGDTFSVTWSFDSDDKVTRNGTYRISSTKTQSGETQASAVIIVLDNEKSDYFVNASTSEVSIDGMTYKVSNFSRTGFTLKFSGTSIESNGDTEVYEEELRFTR